MTPRKVSKTYTDEQLVTGISNAIKAGDVAAVEAMMVVLTGQNPKRASEVFDTMRLGVLIMARFPWGSDV